MTGASFPALRLRWAGLLLLVLVVALPVLVAAPPRAQGGDTPPGVVHLGEDVELRYDGEGSGLGAGPGSLPGAPTALGGYSLMLANLGIRSSYTIRIATDHPMAWWLQGPLEDAAAQLNAVTGANYQMGPPTGGGPAGDGEIVVSFVSGSKCGSLGCATPYWTWVGSEPPRISRANIWINPSMIGDYGMMLQIVLHEMGHAAGLGHYEPNFEGARQMMYPVAYDWDLIHSYRSGDRNGLNTVADNGFREPCPPFNDVYLSNPFCDDIAWLAGTNIASGFGDGTFKPASGLTRQAMASFLYRMEGSPSYEIPPGLEFSDVGPSHPFYEAIMWIASEGITGGFGDGTFKPGANMTRQATAAFLYRLAGEPPLPLIPPVFLDVGILHPFVDPIRWIASEGISAGFGDGSFRPGLNLTRQAMAAFLHRLSDLGY